MKAYIHHMRRIQTANGTGYCSKGARQFAARHNLSYEDFLKNGIDIEILRALDDDMALAVIREVEKDGE